MIVSSMGFAEWDGAVRSMPRPTFSGRGAPIVAMPSGGLNRGIPTGYEGQPWVNKDWGMGDLASAGRETKKLLGFGRVTGACIGGVAGALVSAKLAGGYPTPVSAAIATAIGAIGGLIVANAALTAVE